MAKKNRKEKYRDTPSGEIMSYLQWSSGLDTGVAVIDTQPKRIIDHTNELHAAVCHGRLTEANRILGEPLDHKLEHRNTEEDLLGKTAHPLACAHIRQVLPRLRQTAIGSPSATPR
ncbi:MAG: hypothetical protein PXX77_01065 [Gallionella sp.]|nr:hypothetical protein [Gallionella sp.]